MLPPFWPLVAVEIACPSAGATPKQPIIGASGSDQSRSRSGGSASRTVPAVAVDDPDRRAGAPAGSRTKAGSTTFGASTEKVQPVARFGVMRSIGRQRVARLGALDEERPGHRVGPRRRAARRARRSPTASSVS